MQAPGQTKKGSYWKIQGLSPSKDLQETICEHMGTAKQLIPPQTIQLKD